MLVGEIFALLYLNFSYGDLLVLKACVLRACNEMEGAFY